MERTPYTAIAVCTLLLVASAPLEGADDTLFKGSFEPMQDNSSQPAIQLVTSGTLKDDDGTPGVSAGDSITYTFRATNTGNVSLNSIKLVGKVSGVSISNTNLNTLSPGASRSRSGSYILKQSDVDSGKFINTVQVTAQCSSGCPVTDTNSDTRTLARNADIKLVKTGVLNDDDGKSGVSAGDTISYTFKATNTGNITLTGVVLEELVSGVSVSDSNLSSIAPGATRTRTGSYTLKQSDIDSGNFKNTARVTGQCGSGCPVSDTDSDTRTLARDADITLVKTGVLNDNDGTPGASAGDTISYTFKATNTGNVTLTNVLLEELVSGVSVSNSNLSTISPGASRTRTGSYTLKQSDINAGSFENNARVTGQCTSGCPVSDTDSDTRTFTGTASIEIIKTGVLKDTDGTPGASAGDRIDYSFTVRNTGSVSLSNIVVSDNTSGVNLSGSTLSSLAAGAQNTSRWTATYILTQSDVNAGSFTNNASVTAGCSGSGCSVSDQDSDTRSISRNPAIQLTKSGTLNDDDGTPGASPGDTISYAFTIRNTGNVTLSNITLQDNVAGVSISGSQISSLAPGASNSSTFSGNYSITQSNINAGSFTNTATVTGQCSDNDCPVNDSDSDTKTLEQQAGDLVCKTFFRDNDEDDFGDPQSPSELCSYSPSGPPTPVNMAENDLDCDDSNPSVHPDANETTPDENFTDENCDGVDGNLSLAILVSELEGDDYPICGTIALPCRTLEKALSRAESTNKSQVYVQEGLYDEALILEEDIKIYGGYSFIDWSRSWLHDTVVFGEIGSQRGYAVEVDNASIEIHDMILVGPHAAPGKVDTNSYVVYAHAGSNLLFNGVLFDQGNGIDGVNGSNAQDASQSRAPSGLIGGSGATSGGAFCNLDRASGGTGVSNPSCSAFSAGGTGGVSGKMNTSLETGIFDRCIEEATNGSTGNDAALVMQSMFGFGGTEGSGDTCSTPTAGGDGRVSDGTPGTGGSAGTINTYNIWLSGRGENGSKGLDGGGGGGGGGAGGCDSSPEAHGGAGGGGGAGGCRANSVGTGGTGGGGSFGIFINQGSVEVKNSVFLRGAGGHGGHGGSGGTGQPGGFGGLGGNGAGSAKDGATGGMGGRGGHSGGGGGGAGGPSCGILARNSSVNRSYNNDYFDGQGGPGGAGGSGPVSGNSGQNGSLCQAIEL